jgi:hypothetical protein
MAMNVIVVVADFDDGRSWESANLTVTGPFSDYATANEWAQAHPLIVDPDWRIEGLTAVPS